MKQRLVSCDAAVGFAEFAVPVARGGAGRFQWRSEMLGKGLDPAVGISREKYQFDVAICLGTLFSYRKAGERLDDEIDCHSLHFPWLAAETRASQARGLPFRSVIGLAFLMHSIVVFARLGLTDPLDLGDKGRAEARGMVAMLKTPAGKHSEGGAVTNPKLG